MAYGPRRSNVFVCHSKDGGAVGRCTRLGRSSPATSAAQALVTRAPIEQARGILMVRLGLDAEQGFRVLTDLSVATRLTPRTVAVTLVRIATGKTGRAGDVPATAHAVLSALTVEAGSRLPRTG